MNIFSKNQSKKVVVNADNHGYKPDVIKFKVGKPANVKFIPTDNMGCMNEIVFKKLGIYEKLDGQKEVNVKIPTEHKGEYDFACGMNMFHGKVVVE